MQATEEFCELLLDRREQQPGRRSMELGCGGGGVSGRRGTCREFSRSSCGTSIAGNFNWIAHLTRSTPANVVAHASDLSVAASACRGRRSSRGRRQRNVVVELSASAENGLKTDFGMGELACFGPHYCLFYHWCLGKHRSADRDLAARAQCGACDRFRRSYDKHRKPILSEARDAVSRSFGGDFAQALVLENPAAIIAGLPLPSSRKPSRDRSQKFLGKIG